MSSSTIPKEQQTAYERWELSSFAGDSVHSEQPARAQRKESVPTSKIAEVLEGVRQEAYTKGLQEGFAVGMDKAKAFMQQDIDSIRTLSNSFADALSHADEKIEESMLTLALDLAKAMLKTNFEVNPQVILPVVRDAIHYLPEVQKPAIITVHPSDAKILREHMTDELSEKVWQIQEDGNIERGGCLVETGTNQIDATNATRWKRISDALAQDNRWLTP